MVVKPVIVKVEINSDNNNAAVVANVEIKFVADHKRKSVCITKIDIHFYVNFNAEIIFFFSKFAGKREPPKSKEQLDAELDQYMVNTKSSLDQEMSIYTK